MKYVEIFAVSDIHGHCDELKRALEAAGFESGNPEQLLVVIGDCFDRGRKNRETFEFLCSVENKVLIRGNHEDFLWDILDNGKYESFHARNGTDVTVHEFFGEENVDSMGNITMDRETVKALRRFMGEMRDYFEAQFEKELETAVRGIDIHHSKCFDCETQPDASDCITFGIPVL